MKHLLVALFACVMAVGQTVPTPLPGDPLRIPPQGSITPAAVTGARICTISSSSATAYVGATSPAMSTYPAGVEVRFTANQTSGAAPTLNCGGGAMAIRDALASAAIPSGFMESGYVYTVRSNGTYWLMQEPAPGAAGQKFLTNVGIGTTGPVGLFHTKGTNDTWIMDSDNATPYRMQMSILGGGRSGLGGVNSVQFNFSGTNQTDIQKVEDFTGYAWDVSGSEKMRLDTNGNVGIATPFPTGAPAQKLTTAGSIFAYDMSTLGAEKATSDATCTGWTLGAGWACASGVITHTAGNTATATYTASVIAGNVYRLTLTSTGRTAGSVTPSLGGVAGAANSVATLATYDIATTGTGALTLTLTTDFDGAITVNGAGQISVKPGLASTISAKSISHRPIVFADLGTVPTPKNGDQLYCGDCAYGARGDAASGSGTGAFLGYINGAWKNM